MTGDEMRAALMAVLAEVPELDAEFVADRILPTVRGIVAGELRAAADWLWEDNGEAAAAYHHLVDRADVLDPTS